MNKKIKKISMISTGFSIVAIGSFAGASILHSSIAVNTILKQTEQASYVKKGGNAVNRYYNLVFTNKNTVDLQGVLGIPESIVAEGDLIFDFLTTYSTSESNIGWKYGTTFKNGANDSNDLGSIHSLLRMENTHVWKNAFDPIRFISVVKKDAANNKQLNIQFNVDYVFLGHNLYGITFS